MTSRQDSPAARDSGAPRVYSGAGHAANTGGEGTEPGHAPDAACTRCGATEDGPTTPGCPECEGIVEATPERPAAKRQDTSLTISTATPDLDKREWVSEQGSAADVRERALAHIKRCDELFDGNVIRQDREFAYNQVRLLALELLEMVVESG